MSELEQNLQDVQEKIGYRFKNMDLLYQAFTRRSYSAQYGGENNEVLEFIGDSTLDFYVVKIFAEEFGFLKSESKYYDSEEDFNEFCIVANKNEDDFTKLKTQIVSNKNLAKRIDILGFAEYLYVGDCDIKNNVKKEEKVKADLFESIVGAIAIDCTWNIEKLTKSIWNMLALDNFLDDIDTEEERPPKFKEENAINTLKELAEKGMCTPPEYSFVERELTTNNEYQWECTCLVKCYDGKMKYSPDYFKIFKDYMAQSLERFALALGVNPFGRNNISKTSLATSKKEAKKRAGI